MAGPVVRDDVNHNRAAAPMLLTDIHMTSTWELTAQVWHINRGTVLEDVKRWSGVCHVGIHWTLVLAVKTNIGWTMAHGRVYIQSLIEYAHSLQGQ